MRKTVDGFPIKNPSLAKVFLARLDLNQWSKDKKLKVPVMDFYFNPGKITLNDKTIEVGDRELFINMARRWTVGDRYSKPLSREEALALAFEMA